MSKRVLNNPRELSDDELKKMEEAQSKWFPQLVQSYNTTLYQMMASPFKKGLVIFVVMLVLLGIYSVIDKNMKLNFIYVGKSVSKLAVVICLVVMLFYAGSAALAQHKLNQNLQMFLTITKENATKFDYESSNVIQSKLLRNSYRSGGSSLGSGILGGALGFGLGSRGGRSGRRR